MPKDVKCADCGYLAIRHRDTRQLLDAEDELRTTGYLLSELPISGQSVYEQHLICFAQQVCFRTEIGGSPNENSLKTAVQKVRSCDGFAPWKQGFTPKEHYEMIQEEARLKWQSEQEAADRSTA